MFQYWITITLFNVKKVNEELNKLRIKHNAEVETLKGYLETSAQEAAVQ